MGGKGSGRKSTRGWLYFFARLLGDFSAVSKGRSLRRVKRRLVGKAAGRSIMRWVIVIGLLIPIYEGNDLIPSYYAQKDPDGTVRIYGVDQVLIPKFIIKDNGIYDPAKPLIPLFQIQESLIEEGQ